MTDVTRRRFLGSVAAAIPAAAIATSDSKGTPGAGLATGPLNPELLQALGRAVLPSELGTDGIDRVVSKFQRWLKEYQPEAELLHGYGTGEIRYTPDDPGPRWEAQLQALEAESNRKLSIAFADLDADDRRLIVSSQIADDRLERFPMAARTRHVALGLLAYFYASPEATDLCYRASIAPYACRPLTDSPARPGHRAPRTRDGKGRGQRR